MTDELKQCLNPKEPRPPSPTPIPEPEVKAVCGNGICEEGEKDDHHCPPCTDPPHCPLAPCWFKEGACPQDCRIPQSPTPRPKPTITPKPKQLAKLCEECGGEGSKTECVPGLYCSTNPDVPKTETTGVCTPRPKDYAFCQDHPKETTEDENHSLSPTPTQSPLLPVFSLDDVTEETLVDNIEDAIQDIPVLQNNPQLNRLLLLLNFLKSLLAIF
jgi:hypothetical protein